MKSIASQSVLNTTKRLEIAVYNDGSTDKTQELLEKWQDYFTSQGVGFMIAGGITSKGVGAAKNGAVKISSGAATFSVKREQIWKIQLDRIQKHVLPYWDHFTVWNAGKAGRRLVRSLNPNNLNKVVAFCDVDKNKIGHCVELYCPIERKLIALIEHN
ncbi:hypothetical protein B5X24_HaOG215673 [Helicoverpa armigera]|nr:hypothetical protein B5X24_HaOG215673 [Helicoverpa armigera]